MAAASTSAAATTTPPALLEATRKSTLLWQDDLQALFEQAKDRFPDVVWDLSEEDGGKAGAAEEVWGHKGAYLCSNHPGITSNLHAGPSVGLRLAHPEQWFNCALRYAR